MNIEELNIGDKLIFGTENGFPVVWTKCNNKSNFFAINIASKVLYQNISCTINNAGIIFNEDEKLVYKRAEVPMLCQINEVKSFAENFWIWVSNYLDNSSYVSFRRCIIQNGKLKTSNDVYSKRADLIFLTEILNNTEIEKIDEGYYKIKIRDFEGNLENFLNLN